MKKARAHFEDPENKRKYTAQLEQMTANGRAWLQEHPGADIRIQYNYPPQASFIAAISVAVNDKLVIANGPGMELLKALAPWDNEMEPTVNMCRTVVEHLIK